jgi:hypothetical protein
MAQLPRGGRLAILPPGFCSDAAVSQRVASAGCRRLPLAHGCECRPDRRGRAVRVLKGRTLVRHGAGSRSVGKQSSRGDWWPIHRHRSGRPDCESPARERVGSANSRALEASGCRRIGSWRCNRGSMSDRTRAEALRNRRAALSLDRWRLRAWDLKRRRSKVDREMRRIRPCHDAVIGERLRFHP